MKSFAAVAVLLALSSCSSPPKPPTVDGSQRRPVNASVEVDLQSCRSELQNERIVASDRTRDSTSLRARLAALLTARVVQPPARNARSTVYTVLFPYGATSAEVPGAERDLLVARAQAAPLIVLSGRTDGTTDSAQEARIARGRAEFMRDVLTRAGVPASRIRTTWQPTGDHAADNGSPAGRSLNRRVEIELYEAAPLVERFGASAAAG